MVPSIHRLSRLLAFGYACYTSYRTWNPPASLAGEPDQPKQNGASDGGWRKRGYPTESDISPSFFRYLYIFAMSAMTVSDLGILYYFSGGMKTFIDEAWSVSDVLALVAMHYSVQLRESAFRALGAFFTFKVTTTQDQKLITTGPYSRLMHPSYTGLIFQRTALVYWLGLKHNLLIFVLYTLCGIPGIASRIYHEEAELSKHFGKDKFSEYKQNRWRLIPHVI